MTINRIRYRVITAVALMLAISLASIRMRADTGTCGGQMVTLPFTDVPSSNVFFCSIAEAFFSALTNGTTSTTYSPAANVPREQMAAFVTRTLDQSLRRGSPRASLRQWWAPTSTDGTTLTTVGAGPRLVECDGADLWVASLTAGNVSRVRASDGKLLETWTMATSATGVLTAKGRVFVTGQTTPGNLYQIDPSQAATDVTLLTSGLGNQPQGIAFDGSRVWTANVGSVSIVSLNPVSVTNAASGFSTPFGLLYDGANIWVTDNGDNMLKKLDSGGNIVLPVTVGSNPQNPVFDGTNIWVPNKNSNNITVVRAATGTVLATLTGNGLNGPVTAAFDGERILVTNATGLSVSLWKATDLTPITSVSMGAASGPFGACSDGRNFWVTLMGTDRLARF